MSKERPVINGIVYENTGTIESFQNGILRPIIKMQHDLLIASFKMYLEKRTINFSSMSLDKKGNQVETIYTKDSSYKNLVLGMIIGHFKEEEFYEYAVNTSEYNRRIIQIVKKRIKDSISEL